MLTGCAVAVAFKAGVFNIGIEGQFLLGAASAATVALVSPRGGPGTILFALCAGAAGGLSWAFIAAWLRDRFGVLEVISTIMLNFIAAFGVAYAVRGPLQEPTHSYPQTEMLADALRLPRLGGGSRLHAGFIIAVMILLLCGWVFRYTAAGFRLLVVGENSIAARSAGRIDVRRLTFRAFLVSGAIAGLAGAIEVLGVTFALYEDISPGYGYTAIAVALLARLDPWWILASSVLFGALEAGAGALQRDAGIPATIVTVIEAALILAVVGAQAHEWRRDAISTIGSREGE
jgi:simple sugar transport system permease protein